MKFTRVFIFLFIACLILDSCYAPRIPSLFLPESSSAKRKLEKMKVKVAELNLLFIENGTDPHQRIPSSLNRSQQVLTEQLEKYRRIVPNLSENTKRIELPRLIREFEHMEYTVYKKMWQDKDYVQYRQQYRDVLHLIHTSFPVIYQDLLPSVINNSLSRRSLDRFLVERAYVNEPNYRHLVQEMNVPLIVQMPGAEGPSHIAYNTPLQGSHSGHNNQTYNVN